MFKSKHSGWTWDLKRTPFGGGGGIVSAITDPISSALGTDGSGGGALGALASVDPGPAIGSGLASVDNAVNQIPGGWITVAGVAAGGAALAYAPEVMALAASEGITPEAAAIATNTAPIDVATGATVPLDTLATSTAGADSVLAAPDVAVNLAPASSGSFGSITAPLEGSGAVSGAGATTLGGGGLTGALPAGVVVGDGTLGTTVGATYMATDSGALATDMFGNAIPASSTGVGGFAPTSGLSASDIATNAKRLQSIAKLLGTGGSAVSGVAAPTAQQWNQQATSNLAQATPQQFGGLYEMNKNPFTFQNPLASALAGGNKTPAGLDVSGQQGTSLNTQQQNQIYSSLLRA